MTYMRKDNDFREACNKIMGLDYINIRKDQSRQNVSNGLNLV